MEMPRFELPRVVEMPLERLQSLTDDELMTILSGETREGMVTFPVQQLIAAELSRRASARASKPRAIDFFVAIMATLGVIVSILVGWLSLTPRHSPAAEVHVLPKAEAAATPR